MPLNIYNSVIK